MSMWIESYRPNVFKDVIGIPESIPEQVKKDDFPHMLFVGPPGTGKTTTARIIIKSLGLEYIELNASDERGIGIVRDKIKGFAMTSSLNKKIKIVFLDEADGLTPEAQTSLRATIERYHNNCRFICTANYDNKIIDALQSRLTKFVFAKPTEESIIKRLKYIISNENLDIEDEALNKIMKLYYPDMRKMINKLQEVSNLNKKIKSDDIHVHDKIIPQLMKYIETANFISARQLCLDSHLDYWGLINNMCTYILDNNDSFKPRLVTKLYHRMGECLFRLHFSVIPSLTFEDFLLYCMEDYAEMKKGIPPNINSEVKDMKSDMKDMKSEIEEIKENIIELNVIYDGNRIILNQMNNILKDLDLDTWELRGTVEDDVDKIKIKEGDDILGSSSKI